MPGRSKLKQGLTETSKEEGAKTDRSTASIRDYYSGGKRSFSYKKNDRGKIVKVPQFLTGGQSKIAAKAPPTNKIDEKDFAVLRAEKAKDRDMGLQDEKVKPGKVMKAKRGHFSKSNISGHNRFMKSIGVFPKVSSGAGGKGSGTGGRDTRTITEKGQFIKRRKQLAGMNKLAKVATGRAGAIGALLGAGAVGLNMAGRKLKKVLDERKARKRDTAKVKKMGGGMMQKPMGYKSGKSIKVACKLGRNKPTKLY